MSPARDLKFDGLKFLLVLGVVICHLGYNDYGIGLNKMFHAFLMPVFIFISGFFTSMNTSAPKQRKWIKKTLIIYAIAQVTHYLLRILLELCCSRLKDMPFDTSILTWKVLITPELTFWYLVCLVYWRIAAWKYFQKIDDIKLLAISVALALVSGFIPVDTDFAFQRAFTFFPFFVLGIIFKKRNLLVQLERIHMGWAVAAMLLGLFATRFLPTYLPMLHYANWHQLIWRILQTALGCYLCLFVVRVSRHRFTEKFADFGAHTLWIYIGHTYLITIGWKVFPDLGIKFSLFTAVLIAIAYCAVFIGLSKLYKKRQSARQQ